MFASAHRWILNHDDSKAFVVLYIGLAVLLAIILGLFWLALVVGVHLVMEMIKQHHIDSRPLPVLTRSLWELKLDIGLVLCGLVIGLYIDVVFGIVGIGHAGRAGAQAAARASMWPRVIRGVLLTLDDVALVAKGATLKKKKGEVGEEVEPAELESEVEAATETTGALSATGTGGVVEASPRDLHDVAEPASTDEPSPSEDDEREPLSGSALWGNWIAARWGLGDKLSLGFTVVNLLLIVAAPLLTHHTATEAWALILEDMHPFPEH